MNKCFINIFCKKFNYYEPFNLVSKFIDFNYLYSSWNIKSLQNIENILNNTNFTLVMPDKIPLSI